MAEKRHDISTIAELIDLVSEENIEVLSKDMNFFLQFILQIKQSKTGLIMKPVFSWVDDNEPGLNKVTIEGIEVSLD